MVSFHRSVNFRNLLTNTAIVLATLLIVFTFVETVFSFLTPKAESVVCDNCKQFVPHERYGHVPPPNSVNEVSQTCGSDLCYKAKYSYDQFSRRTTGLNVTSNRHLLVFGCSVTFGVGLNDEDTLPYQLQKRTSARVYNYAKMGSGPAHALALLESPDFQDQINEKKGMALYILMPFHTDRVSLNTSTEWLWQTPAYELNSQGEAIFAGRQASTHPVSYNFYRVYNSLRNRFYFLQNLNRDFDVNSPSENEALVVAILKKSKEIYESKFAGHFLIITPRGLPESLGKKIRDAGLEVFSIDNTGTPEDGYVCRCDRHPNGKRNRFIANALAKEISKNQ